MPASKAFLRQMAQFNLDPKKAYTKSDIGSDGHVRARTANPTVISEKEDNTPKPVQKEKTPKKKSTEDKNSVDTLRLDKKDIKSQDKSVSDEQKLETTNESQVTGDNTSDESNVKSKEESTQLQTEARHNTRTV